MRILLGKPVPVSLAPVGERRWGFWNFPYMFRMPDGALALTHHIAADSELEYGAAAPFFVSDDEGRSWRRVEPPVEELGLHPTHMVHVPGGECFFISPQKPVPLAALGDAKPVGRLESYGSVDLYDLSVVPQEHRTMRLMRWLPREKRWVRESALLDLPNGLLWKREKGGPANLFIESKPIVARDDGSLIVADFRNAVRLADGSTPTRRGVTILQSADRGSTWRLRGYVAYHPTVMYGEPFLAYAPNGDLLCTLRTAGGHGDTPMYIARSCDHGRTWSAPEYVDDVGVFPAILTLGCGVMVVSFGRPGMWMRFSNDPAGRAWGERITLVEPGAKNTDNTCGYSSIEPLDDRRFLIAYSDFNHIDTDGQKRKAILVREVSVEQV